ncbi:MAG: helix-turn-helix domain-containing protein [Xanthobacteraceae bacterium]|nr:helix-turn-helix domain-containing protein [Xanthobacteraceae bacterium]
MHVVFTPTLHRTVDSFQSGVRQVCGNYIVRSASGGGSSDIGQFPFAARTGLLRRDGMELAYVRLPDLEIERTAAQIRTDFVDHFVFTMQLSGAAEMAQGTATAHLRPNDIFISDATRPSRFRFASGAVEQISLHVPRSEGLGRFGRLLDAPALIRGHSGFAIALKVLLQRVTRQMTDAGAATVVDGDDDPADQSSGWFENDTPERLREALFSVLASALLDAKAGGNAPREKHDRLYEEALCVIHRKANDPGFGPGQLCDELGASPRQLQRSFARHGDSAREQLLSTRLDRARRRILTDPGLTVTEIAYASGFNDLSFFYRAYRRQFGVAPGERR